RGEGKTKGATGVAIRSLAQSLHAYSSSGIFHSTTKGVKRNGGHGETFCYLGRNSGAAGSNS
ncbi:MAG: hypothetical protein V3V31_03760, partial [Methylococcales bacterium]